MIDPVTEVLLQETLPSDTTIQTQFKLMIDDEAKKCEEITSGPDFDGCRALATAHAIKKFMYKYNKMPDEMMEMVMSKLQEIKKRT
jgi:hypothetical protein